jgi:PAS domain S-box-containing protein
MASDRGPFRVSKQQLDEFARGVRHSVDSEAYGVEHGLLSTDCVGGYSPSTTRTSDGAIWFGTVEGVSVVDPSNLVRNTIPPPVHIDAVLIDGAGADPLRAVAAPPGRGDLEFHYAGLCFVAPEKVSYRYRLEGYDKGWVDAGHRAAAYYSNIPPGHYRFHVIAANNDGVWNTVGAAFVFDLQPHFYQTLWFVAGCAALVLAAGLGLHNVRTRQLRVRGEVLARHVAERSEANTRLQAEILERQNVERALRASEERYRSFFDEDLAGAFIASPEGKIVACNPAFARMFGFNAPANAIGFDTAQLFRETATYEQLATRLHSEHKVHDYALELQRVDGSVVNVVASLIANFDEQHVLVQTKGYFIDVTERRELESQLRHAQKMEAVGRLAGGIAHDFNNLLTGIIGYAQLLLHEHNLSPQATASAHEIFNAGKLAAVLTRQLLTFSRREIVEPRVLDLNAAVAELKRMLQRLIGEDIELDLRLSDEPLHVRADPGQIEQIIMNLAINSRDAMSRGGRLTIATTAVPADSPLLPDLTAGPHVKLTVSDNGAGMTPAVRARLFEPFFTTKPVGQGTGLGLSTVLGIVRQNKGAIAVETAPDVGTTFEVWLPRVQAAVEPIGTPTTPLNSGKFARVLVVEDNELVRETTAQILRREGYDVVEASSANDAMRLMSNASFSPDLVLTDVVMPDRNGRDLADDLARLRPHLRVVFMSGYTDDAMIRYGLETHRRFVEKPFTRESLLRKMREALND